MNLRACSIGLVTLVLLGTVRVGGQDVTKIIADARAALGGEKKLSSLQTLAATGQSVRVTPEGSQAPTDYEMAFELPDKFTNKEVMAMLPGAAITRTTGFNGETGFEVIDQPPAAPGRIVIIRGPGGDPNAPQTPEQQAERRRKTLVSAKQDFSRLLLGIIASGSAAYPLQVAYGGQAESPDGKADIIDVKGEDGFAARLFIDTKTHLPLMLSWTAKEPLVIRRTIGGGRGDAPAGGHAEARPMPEDRERLMKQAQEQEKEAAAKARLVEYRLYYGDYQDVDGIKVPFRLQRSIDGKPTEEVTLEKVKVNGKIDPRRFQEK